ncbi:MAG: DUF4349 domain-containing protein [Clostridia bacterium]|nr:DUF4349 domain-containing protein [Clostridia bacterium]
MKKLTLISSVLALTVMLSACSASKGNMTADNSFESPEKEYFYSSQNSAELKMESDSSISGALNYGSTADSAQGISNTIREEKLVYTSRVTLETEDFDKANETLHATIKSLGGIIISENAYNLNSVNHSGLRSIDITVRIPQESYETFLAGMEDSYNVASVQNTVDNLTDYYYDNENRLRSYRVQEERLFTMLEKAETVEEMLQIEERLCDVQYQIEALTNTQNTIDNDVKYSTFYINLNEVTKYTSPAPKTFGDRLNETVKESGEAFAEFSEGLLFAIIYTAPYIVIFGIALAIGIIVAKKKKRAKATEPTKEEKDEK